MAKQKEEKAQVTTTVQDVLQSKAEQSAKNVLNGKAHVEVSLKGKVSVRFTSDYGHMKKDKVYNVSPLAFDVYQKAGVVEKI